MLFGKDKKDDGKGKEKSKKKFSFARLLFNPSVGNDVRPVVESWRMFVGMIAFILSSNRLFPKDHPALRDPRVPLTFGQLFAISFNRLSFTKEGIPQIVLFVAVWGCLLLSVLFMVVFIFSFFVGSAQAQVATDGMFTSPAGANDWANNWIDFMLLGKGIPTSSGVVSATTTGCSFQKGLGTILAFFSTGVLVLAGIILIYHLGSMIAETAHTGKPMGRANQIWAPIRLVFAIGLLVPIASANTTPTACEINGLNTGQYMVMQIAKWGSGFASNAWARFLTSMGTPQERACTEQNKLSPGCITVSAYVRQTANMMISNYACVHLYNKYISEAFGQNNNTLLSAQYKIDTVASRSDQRVEFKAPRGTEDAFCGGYEYKEVSESDPYASVYNAQNTAFRNYLGRFERLAAEQVEAAVAGDFDVTKVPNEPILAEIARFQSRVDGVVQTNLKNSDKKVQEAIDQKTYIQFGWLAAGAWFNTIARKEMQRSNSVQNGFPSVLMPKIYSLDDKDLGGGIANPKIRTKEALERFNKWLGSEIDPVSAEKAAEYGAEYKLKDIWTEYNPIELFFRLVDWAGGFVNLWDDKGALAIKFDKTQNPLAEISSWGQNNVRMGTLLIGVAAGAKVAAAVLAGGDEGILKKALKMLPGGSVIVSISDGFARLLEVVSMLCMGLGMLFFLAGFTIGFLMPLFPFFRFFFGSVTWLLSIMGAVVAMPLFALAHLSPYGEGLPGQAAQKGYYYLLHIFLRPILMILGLIVGFLLFSAAISFLNDFFIIAAKGTGAYVGGTPALAKVTYSFIYAGMVFTLCNTCFKTIGYFPQTALGWMGGQGVPEESVGDPGKIAATAGIVSGMLMKDVVPKAINATAGIAASVNKSADDKSARTLASKRHHQQMISQGMRLQRDENGQEIPGEYERGPSPQGQGMGSLLPEHESAEWDRRVDTFASGDSEAAADSWRTPTEKKAAHARQAQAGKKNIFQKLFGL